MRHGRSAPAASTVGWGDPTAEETTTTPTDKSAAMRELRHKCGNLLGDWLCEGVPARRCHLLLATIRVDRYPAEGGRVIRIGDQVCAVGYYRPGHRGKETIP